MLLILPNFNRVGDLVAQTSRKTVNGKPNFTAWFVLQGVLVAMRHPQFSQMRDDLSLFLYEALAKAASRTRLLSGLIYKMPYALQYRIGELVTTPGRLRHYLLRKMGIAKHMRSLLDEGQCTQVVILGAGLDVLALRLAREYPDVKFIEIDIAESQSFKQSSLAACAIDVPANLEFVEGDLRDPLCDILAQSSCHDPLAKTLWLAEGFFMFIPEASVCRILKDIHALSAPESYCIFTTLPCKEQGGAFARRLQKFYLKKEDSVLYWSINYPDVPAFMQSLGYAITWQVDYQSLHREYAENRRNHPAMGENIHVAKLMRA